MKTERFINSRVEDMSQLEADDVLIKLNVTQKGMILSDVQKSHSKYGSNELFNKKKDSVLFRLRRAFVNPFSVVLFIIAAISLLTDIFLPREINQNQPTVIIILLMLLVSGIVRLIQEIKAKIAADKLNMLINTKVNVLRDGEIRELESTELVVGDIVTLYAGDRVPADIRIIESQECYSNQSSITGESTVRCKNSDRLMSKPQNIDEYKNTLFAGASITGGSCCGIVLAVGKDTVYGSINNNVYLQKNGFDKGSYSIAWVLIKFMLFLIPIVFVANGITQGNWIVAFLYAISVAVGLTPELLPMVITACMSKSSKSMRKKQTLVKNINAMQSFGSMDILCVDKTGTLTDDKLTLEYYMDIVGNESRDVLDCAYVNSFFHSGIKNNLDDSILRVKELSKSSRNYDDICNNLNKLDEIPFDYQRKSSSVLIEKNGFKYLIAKGDVASISERCKYAFYKGKIIEKDEENSDSVSAVVDDMLEDGMKVIAIAFKQIYTDKIGIQDESELTLLGFICFFDAPLATAKSAIARLKDLKIDIKVLTGDNKKVTKSICKRLKISVENMLTGEEIENLSANELMIKAEKTNVFAELTPRQKQQIVDVLKTNGHTVGFLGDGMNDLPAVTQADVGISVNSACEALKESADVILLKKDLDVLHEGVIEGRKSFANMLKYINITASSNLGNICAIVLASIFLPFTPMTSLQLLLLNLLYDILCLILPWDKVDSQMINKPLKWSGTNLPRFMITFGSVSTIFDILTFGFLFFFLCPQLCGGSFFEIGELAQSNFIALFQTGWFLESMWTQILILYLLRTKKLNVFKNGPSLPVLAVIVIGIALFTLLPFTLIGSAIGMIKMPGIYFVFLMIIVISYLLTVTFIKTLYLKRHRVLY